MEGYLSGTDAAPGVYADTVRLTVSDALQAHTKGLMWYSDANEAIEYWNGSAIVTMTSGRKVVENNSEPPTIGVAESGYVITNAGSDGADAFTLPDAAAGLTYTFVVMAAQELRVTPAAGDKIVYGSTVMDAAEYYVADAIGESLTIVAVDATNWVVISSTGTWTEEIP